MVRKMIVMACVAAMFGWTAPTQAGGCNGCSKVAKGAHGMCCGKGKAFGVSLTSQRLYQSLQGKEVSAADAAKCPCPNCKSAVAGKGSCDICKVTGGKMYDSPVAYALAKGVPHTAALVDACAERCAQCKVAFGKDGRCEKCGVGFVAGHLFQDTTAYEFAVAAFNTLKKAAKVAQTCEACAVAMVTDGNCENCKVRFKDGRVARNCG